jgi:excisionase family DNA binding protein
MGKSAETRFTPRLIGVAEFSRQLGISIWTARLWAYERKIASVKMGSRLQIPYTELDRIIEENLRPANPPGL